MTVSSFQNGSFLGGSATAASLTTSGIVTASSLYNTEYLDKKYDYNDTKESYEIAYSGRDAAIETKISNICSYLANGQEDKALAAYEELLNEMTSQTRYEQLIDENGEDTQLRSIARQLIETELGGDLEDFIRENSRDAVGVEKQKLLWGDNCDSTTQEDLLEAMCNIEEQEGKANIFTKGIYGTFGIVTKGFDALFGDGKKH